MTVASLNQATYNKYFFYNLFNLFPKLFICHRQLTLITKKLKKTSKFEWTLDDIRIEKVILTPIWANFFFFFEVSALLDVRYCPKLQYCAISRKNNDETLRKWQKP